jgi:perosamine synthetase
MTDVIRIPPSRVVLRDDEIEEAVRRIDRVLRSGLLTQGAETKLFETRFANFLSVSHVVATSSGTSALEIALRALDVAGGEVLVPTNTNFATGIAAINARARLRFYDGGLLPDVDAVARAISEETRAVVVVHIGGHITPRMGDLVGLCRQKGIALVEDAAHAHGSQLRGRSAGAFGDVAAFSFYKSKVLTTGEGGALATNDAAIAELAYSFRNQGFQPNSDLHVRHGNTWRMTEIEAILGSIQLESLREDTRHRNRAIRLYHQLLADHPRLELPEIPDASSLSGYKCIAILAAAELREPLRKELIRRGVVLDREVYSIPLHAQPVFREYAKGDFPVAEDFARSHICFPIWRGIELETVEYIAAAVRAALDELAGSK